MSTDVVRHNDADPDVVMASGGSRGAATTQRWIDIVTSVGPIAVVVVLAVRKRWTGDGGFVYFRVVEQVLAGHGPVFNAGERVEAVSSPAWLAMLTVGDLVSPLRLEYTAAALSITFVGAGLTFAMAASRRVARVGEVDRGVLLPVGAVVVASLWPVWVWSTGGGDTGLTFLWIGVCSWLLTRLATAPAAEGNRRLAAPSWVLVILGLGWVVRSDLVVSSVIFVGIAVALGASTTRQRRLSIIAAAAVPVAYQIFRMGYYGQLVAMPTIAHDRLSLNVERGWSYIRAAASSYALVIPLLAIALAVVAPQIRRVLDAGARRVAVTVIGIAASGIVHVAIVMVTGGDTVQIRMMLPGLFAAVAPFFVVLTTRRNVDAVVLVGVWAAVAAGSLRSDPPEAAQRDGLLTVDDHGFVGRRGDQEWIVGPGLYAPPAAGTGPERTGLRVGDGDVVVAAYKVGAVGYALGPTVPVIDLAGVADPLIAHQVAPPDVNDPAAGDLRNGPPPKSLTGPWLVARAGHRPSSVLANELQIVNGVGFPPQGLAYLEDIAWVRAALGCGQIGQLWSGVSEPLSFGRFVDNLADSLSNTNMRIEIGGRAAYERSCPAGVPLPEPVAEFLASIDRVESLPASSSHGQLAVVGGCDLVVQGTGDRAAPWRVLEGTRRVAQVAIGPARTSPAVIPVWNFGTAHAGISTFAVETDGAGRFRLRRDGAWVAPLLGDWQPIPAGTTVTVDVAPDLVTQAWRMSFGDGVLVGDVSFFVSEPTFDAIRPVLDPPPLPGAHITRDLPFAPPTCSAALIGS